MRECVSTVRVCVNVCICACICVSEFKFKYVVCLHHFHHLIIKMLNKIKE